MSKHVREKSGKLCISYILSSQRGITPSKIDAKGQHKLALQYMKTKLCAKFQLNMSKHVGENCGKLCISYILGSQRDITPSKIDAK